MAKIKDLSKFYQLLGENIRSQRVKYNYSQEELASFLQLTRTSVVNIEKGRQRPPIHTLCEIASFLGISANELFPAIDEKKQIDMMKIAKENVKIAAKKYKDVPIQDEKLLPFFMLSSND